MASVDSIIALRLRLPKFNMLAAPLAGIKVSTICIEAVCRLLSVIDVSPHSLIYGPALLEEHSSLNSHKGHSGNVEQMHNICVKILGHF